MGVNRENQPNIIIVRKKRAEDEHYGGSWKVAYADFVTAMMAFFLVMWLVSQSDAIKEGVGGYFREPAGFKDEVGMRHGGEMQKASFYAGPGGKDERQRRRDEARTQEQLKRTGREIIDAVVELPGLARIGDQIEVELTDEGLRIQLMEESEATFFGLGSAELSARGAQVVATIGRIIGPLGYPVVIEGHTDSRPYSQGGDYSNWELSSDRAQTARRVLEHSGVAPADIVAVRAYADNRLKYPRDPYDPANRRIAILVLNRFVPGIELAERAIVSVPDSVRHTVESAPRP